MIIHSELHNGSVVKRYKRFFTDLTLLDGTSITAHTVNTGSMKGCIGVGVNALVSYRPDPKRKLKYTLELTQIDGSWIGVNTSLTNSIAEEAIKNGIIPELIGYETLVREKTIGDSRIDFYLTYPDQELFLEVKNVTLKENNVAIFPDSVSTRGQKHLDELIKIKQSGKRAAMLFVVARQDVESFAPAKLIDPEYAKKLKEAQLAGVEIYAYRCQITPPQIYLKDKLEVKI